MVKNGTMKRHQGSSRRGAVTQKAGGSMQRKKFVNSILENSTIVNNIIKKLRIKLVHNTKPVKTSSRPTQKGNTAKIATGGGTIDNTDSSQKSDEKVSKLDKPSQELCNAVKQYVAGMLSKLYRKMTREERKQAISDNTKITNLVNSYINDILLWGLDGENNRGSNASKGVVVLSEKIKSGCDSRRTRDWGYYSNPTPAASGFNATRLEQAHNLTLQSDLAAVRSAFKSLLSTERDIRESQQGTPDMAIQPIQEGNNEATKQEKQKARREYEQTKMAAECNYFLPTGIPVKDISKALQNQIVVISSMNQNCDGDLARSGSVFHIIKRAGHRAISTKLQASDFHIIHSRMQEASCYAQIYDSSSDTTADKAKERRLHKAQHKDSHEKLVKMFTSKDIIKNNALGLLFYIRRAKSIAAGSQ